MTTCVIDPAADRRWDDLVARHPRASIFHQRGWLEALRRTYGYRPYAITSARANESLVDGLVFCWVRSWITGTRAVSLPFSDHCALLPSDRMDEATLLEAFRSNLDPRHPRYIEIRPLEPLGGGISWLRASRTYCFHTLDLTASVERLFEGMHRNSIQRKIRRAERERLSYEMGNSTQFVEQFYRLLLLTRRRHRLLPQPRAWFLNLAECLGDRMTIRLARKDRKPVAALLSVRHAGSVVYKYGCSDERHHNLGGMPLLFWRLMEESKASGAEELDLGRSDSDQIGLMTFKDRLGAKRSEITYYRSDLGAPGRKYGVSRSPVWQRLIPFLPGPLASGMGALVYRHMG